MRIRFLQTAALVAVLTILSACATGQPAVIEKLDKMTAVTITYCREPLIMTTDVRRDRNGNQDLVQLGPLEVNRAGTRTYFLWLGITDANLRISPDKLTEGFDSVTISVGDENFRLDVLGWAPPAIGAGEPVYKKLFRDSAEAFYSISLDQIQLLRNSASLTLRTTGPSPKVFFRWHESTKFDSDMTEFLRVVR